MNIQTQKLAKKVNNLVKEYVRIEEDIFKPSLRKALPVPGFYRPVKYSEHQDRLRSMQKELEMAKKEISALRPESQTSEGKFLITLRAYINGLLEAWKQLEKICLNLHKKSQGEAYEKQKYQEEAKVLRELEKKYFETGKKLNQIISEMKK